MEEGLIPQPDGATPLTAEDLEGLIPAHIVTRGELDEWENQNILKARTWISSRRREILDDRFVRELHRRMFDDTWRWAGRYRSDERNIGIDPMQIAVAVRDLCADAEARLAAGAGIEETAIWLHHRLTWIHPFPNGNGRHARLITDRLLVSRGQEAFTWGYGDLLREGETRARYISALRTADAGNFGPLEEFVRSGGLVIKSFQPI